MSQLQYVWLFYQTNPVCYNTNARMTISKSCIILQLIKNVLQLWHIINVDFSYTVCKFPCACLQQNYCCCVWSECSIKCTVGLLSPSYPSNPRLNFSSSFIMQRFLKLLFTQSTLKQVKEEHVFVLVCTTWHTYPKVHTI